MTEFPSDLKIPIEQKPPDLKRKIELKATDLKIPIEQKPPDLI